MTELEAGKKASLLFNTATTNKYTNTARIPWYIIQPDPETTHTLSPFLTSKVNMNFSSISVWALALMEK